MRKCKVKTVAVLGLGMGWSHAVNWKKLGCKVAVVVDTNPKRAAEVAAQVGAEPSTDYGRILRDKSIQALSICTPDHLHFEQAKAAILAGKHVMLEKPMVTNLPDAKKLVRIVKDSGLQLAVGNLNRFVPQFAHLHQLFKAGKLGKVFHVAADYIHDMRTMWDYTPWRKDKKNPQDFWYGGGVHPMDLLRWIGGEIDEIFCYASRGSVPQFPLLSDFSATLKFKSGATGSLLCTSGIRRRPHHEVRFSAYGDLGSMESDLSPHTRIHLHPRDLNKKDWVKKDFPNTNSHPVDKELKAFMKSLAEGTKPEVDVVDGARTIAALAAGLKSAHTGRPEKVELIR
jgi:predicted dehydrogenase